MMKYKAPDGTEINSESYPEVVTYQCICEGIADGIYESIETTGSISAIGIQQIKITRTVSDNSMTITIVESSDEELLQYINENI